MRSIPTLERLLLVFGVLLLGIYCSAGLHQRILSRLAIIGVKAEQAANAAPATSDSWGSTKPNVALWSPGRIKGFKDSLAQHLAPAIGVLRISRARIEVPILEGTDDLSLNRGVGHIAGTAGLGDDGNVGIAGHRDGFFRGLKDIRVGDSIQIETPTQKLLYTVDRLVIVEPGDVSVLDPRGQASLTLVTCYPFYFVGGAPRRFVVQASLVRRGGEDLHPDEHTPSKKP